MSRTRKRPGVKLLELVVALSMVFILFLLLPPGVQKWREGANRTECVNNMKKIGIATHAIHNMYGRLPPLAAATNAADLSTLKSPYRTSDSGFTLFVWLLPFLESEYLYREITNSRGVTPKTAKSVMKQYRCPSDNSSRGGVTSNGEADDVHGYAVSNYVANYLVFGDPNTGSLAGRSRIPDTFIDGTANTIIYAESYGTCGWNAGSLWANIDLSNDKPYSYLPAMCVSSTNRVAAPKGNPGQLYAVDGRATSCNFTINQAFQVDPGTSACSPSTIQSPHPDGANIVLGDASVRFCLGQITITTWNNVCDPRDGSSISDW